MFAFGATCQVDWFSVELGQFDKLGELYWKNVVLLEYNSPNRLLPFGLSFSVLPSVNNRSNDFGLRSSLARLNQMLEGLGSRTKKEGLLDKYQSPIHNDVLIEG